MPGQRQSRPLNAMSRSAAAWIFELEADYTYNIRAHLPAGWHTGCAFLEKGGRRLLELQPNGDARVPAGYCWDGCTPKFVIFDIVCGVPDGIPNRLTRKPKAYYASLLHDALYQFLDCGLPLTRAQVDRIFLELLARDDFAPRWLYYAAVRIFGGAFRIFTRWKRAHNGSCVMLATTPAA